MRPADRLHSSSVGRVGVEDGVAVAQEAAVSGLLDRLLAVGVLDDLLANRVARFNQRRAFSLIISGVSVLFALFFIASIGRSISRPLAELKEVTERINKGDLTTSADIDRRDEIGQLAGAINRLQKTLQGGGKMKAA